MTFWTGKNTGTIIQKKFCHFFRKIQTNISWVLEHETQAAVIQLRTNVLKSLNSVGYTLKDPYYFELDWFCREPSEKTFPRSFLFKIKHFLETGSHVNEIHLWIDRSWIIGSDQIVSVFFRSEPIQSFFDKLIRHESYRIIRYAWNVKNSLSKKFI